MGGEGHMLHAIKSLRANRALLKKRINRKKGDYSGIHGKHKAVFKKTTVADMIAVRKKIKQYKRMEQQRYLLAFGITLAFFYFIYWLLSSA